MKESRPVADIPGKRIFPPRDEKPPAFRHRAKPVIRFFTEDPAFIAALCDNISQCARPPRVLAATRVRAPQLAR